MSECDCALHSDPEWRDTAARIPLLNACHDVTCTGCGWCEWTGRAQLLELTR